MNLARPVYAVYLHENDRYHVYATGNGGYFYRDTRGHTIGSLQAFFIGLPSVWHHSDASGNLVAYSGGCDTFAYDAYGQRVDPLKESINEGLFYTGEQFDVDAQQYYLRARYYDQNTGRFNRMDPFSGSPQDPQSLHKYLYAHCNPVNMVDPTGKFLSAGSVAVGMAIRVMLYVALVSLSVMYVMEKTHILGKNVLQESYLGYIRTSAQRNRLAPELVAAIIATEQKHMRWRDVFGDVPGAHHGHDTSIGLGQVRISTAITCNLVDTTDREQVIERLQDPERNIEAAARYIRIVADMAVDSGAYNPGVDFERYRLHGDEWDYENRWTVICIGSEYNSAPWDGYYTDWWGEQVLGKYKEIDNSGLF